MKRGGEKMFKKILSSIGIGSAKVDTQLSKTVYTAGETMEGVIVIEGGKTEQQIDEIYLSLMSTYIREVDDNKVNETALLEKYKLVDSLIVSPNEVKRIPFHIPLPFDVPITKGKTKVWIQTGLDIKMAIDPQDRDYIEVQPHPLVESFLQTVNSLGFSLREVKCEEASRALRRKYPFVQEFEFKPTSGLFKGRLDELEVIFFTSEHQVEVILEIDRKALGLRGFLAEALERDETLVRFTFNSHDIPALSQTLVNIINKYS